ncbi:alginate lyase [Neolewinella aurantiaca]|uniref:Alginate lyase n=1 Tax=Neolewinella aurantiaca TaxID=2602767 RepID=A0A5C7FSV4_9BACT|nr:polysaccharide lyase 6 family protein [Neolewinella aurantiaca]TXF91167.1 alginate lyase [Neolewinella aurantiaca]
MYKLISKIPLLSCLALLSLVYSCGAPEGLVSSAEELNAAIENAKPGDVITLANGTYSDFEIKLTGTGTSEQPIKLVAQEKGKVFLEGQSNLRISGEYIHVEGLVFRNGFTPTSEVISFRTSKEDLCNNCRITECVIDNYNPSERFESDYWVALYGKHNRFDHNYLTGKRNQGVVLAVRLATEGSRENFHRIDHNFFGHRAVLGSNGGETLRIGTSHYCESNSNTVVESNYFYKCNGEVEIISNKSGQNVFKGNTFFESTGTLTIRHGNEVTIENNFFFGNGVANTGGIRIINAKQTVVNNYLEQLRGYRFRSALTVMNGVPNSPLNRYVQVTDSKAENNVLIDCDHVQLGVGNDEERSAKPERSSISNNVFYRKSGGKLFSAFDDMSGITFAGNIVNPGLEPFQQDGFVSKEIEFEALDSGVKIPLNTPAGDSIRAGIELMATPENTGVTWYPRVQDEQFFGGGKVIEVKAGENTLWEAARNSAPGDIIRLTEAGEYLQTKSVVLTHPLTFEAAQGLTEKPVLTFQKTSLFNIENGGGLTLKGVRVDGKECRDKPLNAVIQTSRYSMINNYKLLIEDCDFADLDINHSFNVLRVAKNTMADSIVLRNSRFENISGSVLALDRETDDIGIYNAQNVVVDNCLFDDIGQEAILVHRGGRDESTLGPMVSITNSTFDEIGGDKRNGTGSSVRLHGTQVVTINDCIFDDSKPLQLHLVVGEPVVNIMNSVFSGGTTIEDNGEPYNTSGLQLNLTEPITTAGGRTVGTNLSE